MHILFADDHRLIREAVGGLLRDLDDTVTVHEADSFPDALDRLARMPQPDLVILDLLMPGMNRFIGLEVMRARCPAVPIVILTGVVDAADAQAALRHGANGFIPKTLGAEAMLGALRSVLAGGRFLPADLAAGAPSPTPCASGDTALGRLTQRERDVLSLLTAGHPNKEIARLLGLREITVKVHLKGVYRKLSVANRTQAVRAAIELGFTPDDPS
ncbi:MAG: response regulator transcription factor [Rhodobacterales bacterium]|nr:response regulator transcription factor [Rhodobacterales bacterium]